MNPAGESVVHVQTKREIMAALDAAGIRPRKRFGQNFLIDGNLMRRLAAAADIQRSDTVLEIGGGTGGLTDLLAAQAGGVVCVEVDRGLHALLTRRFAHAGHVTLIQGDALAGKNDIDPAVLAAVRASCDALGGPAKLVANLPYQIATPMVGNILTAVPLVRRLCFTVQAEVGERMTAAPGSDAYGPISVLVQLWCDVETLARIPPQAFWPAPKVESVMLRLDGRESAALSASERPAFASLVRRMFEFRRKTLRAGLKKWLKVDAAAEWPGAFEWSLRPDAVGAADWVQLYERLVQDGQRW